MVYIKHIKELVRKGQLGRALETTASLNIFQANNDLFNKLILVTETYKFNENENMIGVLHNNTYKMERAKATNALLGLLDEAERMTKEQNIPKNHSTISGNGNVIMQHISTNEKRKTTKQKILFLAANPTDAARVQSDKEYRLTKERLYKNEYYELLPPELALTIENLVIAMNQKPQMVHFSGHGKKEGILIATEDNQIQLMPTRILRRLFKQHKDRLRLVLLNACYSEAQAKVLSELDIYVIGMSHQVKDSAAIDFSSGLYIGLSEGKSVEDAFDDAMIILETKHAASAHLPKVWKNGILMNW